MKNIAWFTFAIVALCAAQPCQAGFSVSLSTPDNLSTLDVGQTITINVNLSGASALDFLDSLGVTVADPPIHFNTPTITAGLIVPDLSGFFTGPTLGVADATYDDFFAGSGTPITTNGLFFAAQFTATSSGTGTFDFTLLSGFQGFDSVTVNNGTPGGLAFTIIEPTGVTPAPSSFLLASLGGAMLALRQAWRMRKFGKNSSSPGQGPLLPALAENADGAPGV